MSDLSVCVDIAHTEAKLGDTLCVVPLIIQLAGEYATTVHVTGAVAKTVKPLLCRLPIWFAACNGIPDARVQVNIQAAYDQGRALNQHMAASICRLAGVRQPALPLSIDLASTPVGLPPGIVLSPFSGSRNPWYKAWPLDRWLRVVHHLAATRREPVYVVAASGENTVPFIDAGAIPLVGLELPEVLDVMRHATLFASIDNGLSHLAHFGDVKRHLLLYPALLPSNLVVNPRARVLRGRPEDIQVEAVIAHIETMLRTEAGAMAPALPQ
ncbi:MAG TPA: hypothetical protein VHO91_05805 [Rhodopila sp.]|nr:hypothetical protein [Rhodopila sp.]